MKNKAIFSIFDSRGALTSDIKSLLRDKSAIASFPTIKAYLESQNMDYDINELKKLVRLAEQEIYDQMMYLSLLQYYIMDRSGDWKESGEQQVKTAMCRYILGIAAQDSLTYEHASLFVEQINKKLEAYEISHLTLDSAQRSHETAVVRFMGQLYKDRPAENISKILRFIGSTYRIFISYDGVKMQPILFEGKELAFDEYPVYLVKKELVRAPRHVLATVAYNKANIVYVRDEALWNIYYQKWVPALQQDGYVLSQIDSDPFWKISQGIKDQALALYGINNPDQLEQHKLPFFKDMRETIMFHEIGHGVTNDYLTTDEEFAIAKAADYLLGTGNDIYDTYMEFLADFAPLLGKKHGAMYNMVKVSKKDQVRAEKLFWIYMSDIWFYDTEDAFMFQYSDFICLVMLRYVKQGKAIDFERMEADLVFNQETYMTDPKSLVERLFYLYKTDIYKMKEICESATYELQSGPSKFPYLRSVAIIKEQQLDPMYTPHLRRHQVRLWRKIFSYVKLISNRNEELHDFAKKQTTTTLKKLFVLTAGKKKAEAYQYDHRKYIADTFLAKGVVPKSK